MTDRGFNSMAPLLIDIGMHYVAPPSKRKGEDQFTEEDAGITTDVVNLCIHVKRAISEPYSNGACWTRSSIRSSSITSG